MHVVAIWILVVTGTNTCSCLVHVLKTLSVRSYLSRVLQCWCDECACYPVHSSWVWVLQHCVCWTIACYCGLNRSSYQCWSTEMRCVVVFVACFTVFLRRARVSPDMFHLCLSFTTLSFANVVPYLLLNYWWWCPNGCDIGFHQTHDDKVCSRVDCCMPCIACATACLMGGSLRGASRPRQRSGPVLFGTAFSSSPLFPPCTIMNWGLEMILTMMDTSQWLAGGRCHWYKQCQCCSIQCPNAISDVVQV
jgi:hypothetical protein